MNLSEGIQSETIVTIEVCVCKSNAHLCLSLFVERIAFRTFAIKFINIYRIIEVKLKLLNGSPRDSNIFKKSLSTLNKSFMNFLGFHKLLISYIYANFEKKKKNQSLTLVNAIHLYCRRKLIANINRIMKLWAISPANRNCKCKTALHMHVIVVFFTHVLDSLSIHERDENVTAIGWILWQCPFCKLNESV